MSAPTLVLVHGAFHGPSCFDLVRPVLHERGILTAAPRLEFVSLADDVGIVTRAIDELDGPAVLFGHSYAGTVITWAGDHPAVMSLVYLTAGVPDVGEGIGSGPPGDEPPVPEGFSVTETGEIVVDAEHAVELFYPDVDPVTAAASVAQLRPWRTVAGQVVPTAAWHTRPVDYIVCRDDIVLPAPTQRWFADRAGAKVHELPGGHSPFVAQPRALADVVEGILHSSPR